MSWLRKGGQQLDNAHVREELAGAPSPGQNALLLQCSLLSTTPPKTE